MFNTLHDVVLNNYPYYKQIHSYNFLLKYKITVYEQCTVSVKVETKYGKGV